MPIVKTNQLTIKRLNDLQRSNEINISILDGNNLYIKKNSLKLTWMYRVAFKAKTGVTRTWLTIGHYPEITLSAARNEAIRIREMINKGINPITVKSKYSDRIGKTFAEVLSHYELKYFSEIKPNTKRNFLNIIRYSEPLNNIIMQSITEHDILNIAEKIKHQGHYSIAHSFIQVIKKLFSYAKHEGFIIDNHLRDLKSSYSFKPRDNYFQPQELGKFVKKLVKDKTVPLVMRIAIYSLIILMVRRSELVEIKWHNVELDTGRIVIERTKTISNFTLIIPKQLCAIWKLLKQSNNGYIFNFDDNTLYRQLVSLCEKYKVKRITPHDLRRTGMSLLAEHGQDFVVIDSALAHTIKGVNRSYLKSNLLEKRAELLQLYADYIDSLINGQVAKIIAKNGQ